MKSAKEMKHELDFALSLKPWQLDAISALLAMDPDGLRDLLADDSIPGELLPVLVRGHLGKALKRLKGGVHGRRHQA